jgi:hypothetical protein
MTDNSTGRVDWCPRPPRPSGKQDRPPSKKVRKPTPSNPAPKEATP